MGGGSVGAGRGLAEVAGVAMWGREVGFGCGGHGGAAAVQAA